MDRYDHAVDIWSLGVVGFEMRYGRHPWKLARNPWRDDNEDCESLRRAFSEEYEEAMDLLARDASTAESSQRYIHRE